MKTLLGLIILVATNAVTIAAEAEADASRYKAGEFSVDTFGTVITDDFANERLGYGVGLNYFFTRQLGIGLETRTERLDSELTFGANAIYRIPIYKTAPYVFAGAGYSWKTEQPNISVGAGLEHRFTEHFGIFGDARLLKDVEGENTPSFALARLGVRFAF